MQMAGSLNATPTSAAALQEMVASSPAMQAALALCNEQTMRSLLLRAPPALRVGQRPWHAVVLGVHPRLRERRGGRAHAA